VAVGYWVKANASDFVLKTGYYSGVRNFGALCSMVYHLMPGFVGFISVLCFINTARHAILRRPFFVNGADLRSESLIEL
jgi:hypothetical protein